MSKKSRTFYESHGKSRNGRTTTVSGGCVVYCLSVTSRIKDYAFQINRSLQTEVKRRKIQAKKKNAKMYGFTAPNGVISTKTNEIAGHFSS